MDTKKLDEKIEKQVTKLIKDTNNVKNPNTINTVISKCIYDEICSKHKLCGDCATDEFQREQYEEDYANFILDMKMELYEY